MALYMELNGEPVILFIQRAEHQVMDCANINDDFRSFESKNGFGEKEKKFASLPFCLNPSKLFQILFGSEIEHSEFVDFEAMTCNFQKGEFYDLLKFCKDYCDGDYDSVTQYSNEECISSVIKEEAFSYLFGGTFIQYSDIRKTFGDNFHTVGYPSKDKIVSVVECTHGIAINALSENAEIASDFLEKLISEEYQIKYSYSWVRRDVLENNVKNSWEVERHECHEDDYENQPIFEINAHSYIPLAGKEDGSSYAGEYIDLMDKGVLLSSEYDIQDIILEEIQAFFEGQKTVEDVADIIQSRVSLYLEERK